MAGEDWMRIQLPSAEELDRQRRYQVLKNYVCAAADACDTSWESLLAHQRSLPGFRRIRRRQVSDITDIGRALILGWTSRLQLSLTDWATQSGMLAYANAWAPVHTYYAVYGSVRALLASQGMAPGDHTAALNAISTMAATRGVMPAPWNVACVDCPHVDDPAHFVGLPAGVTHINDVQTLGNADPALAWPRLLKALETTREGVLERRYKEWCRQSGRKNTFKKEKAAIATRVAPTTVFDLLWRLRVRANYQDAASFVMVTVGQDWHKEFHDALVAVTEGTCLVVENMLVQQVGLNVYETVAQEFCRGQASDGPTAFVADRLRLLTDRSS